MKYLTMIMATLALTACGQREPAPITDYNAPYTGKYDSTDKQGELPPSDEFERCDYPSGRIVKIGHADALCAEDNVPDPRTPDTPEQPEEPECRGKCGSDKPKGDKPKGDKPKGDKPKGDKPKGDKPKKGNPGNDKDVGNAGEQDKDVGSSGGSRGASTGKEEKSTGNGRNK